MTHKNQSWVYNVNELKNLNVKKVVKVSVVSFSVTPWTVAHQAPLSMEFFRKENWSG